MGADPDEGESAEDSSIAGETSEDGDDGTGEDVAEAEPEQVGKVFVGVFF